MPRWPPSARRQRWQCARGCSGTSVTVYGANFADYGGVGSLACVVDGEPPPATLLDSGRVLCSMPSRTAPGVVELTVSLNNGTNGTLPSDVLSFR